MAITKTEFAQRTIGMASALANVADNLDILTKVYTARGFQFTQADLDPLGLTVQDLNNVFLVIQRFGAWVNGQAVTPGDNRTVLNQVRTDI